MVYGGPDIEDHQQTLKHDYFYDTVFKKYLSKYNSEIYCNNILYIIFGI